MELLTGYESGDGADDSNSLPNVAPVTGTGSSITSWKPSIAVDAAPMVVINYYFLFIFNLFILL